MENNKPVLQQIEEMEAKLLLLESKIDKRNVDQLALVTISKGLLELLKQVLNTV